MGNFRDYKVHGTKHIFTFDSNVTIVVRDPKRNYLGQIWGDVEASVGGDVVSAAQFNMLDNRRRIDFCAEAAEHHSHIAWKAYLRDTIKPLRGALDAATDMAPGPRERQPTPWKSGQELMGRKFAKVAEVVPGILPVGVTLLASPPKLGKSRFMLDMALAVANGGKALGGIDVEQGDVLYLCLEDSEQLLQERLLGMLQGEEMPGSFYYASTWRRFDEGGIEDIDRWLESHPKAKLVVVDIFQRVKPIGNGNRNAYELDYAASSQILDLGNKDLGAAITIVHHVNHSKDVSDPMDLINGSNGILGGADGGIVMRAVPGQKGEATLEIAHRRLKVPPPKMALKTDTLTGGWILHGDAHQLLVSEERQQIIEIIRQAGQPLSCRVMASELGKKVEAIRKCVQRMVSRGHLVMAKSGLYDLPPVTKTPVLGVPSVLHVPGVLPVLGDSGQEPDRVGQEGCPSLTIDNNRENLRVGRVGQGGHRFTSESVHDIDQDIAEAFDADRGAYVPRRSDAPVKALDVDTALQVTAKSSRRLPLLEDVPPRRGAASADAKGEQVDNTEEEMF
jgi:hypothetical protein